MNGSSIIRWLAAACVFATIGPQVRADDQAMADRQWALAPYRLRIVVTADSTARPQTELAARIARALGQRLDVRVGPRWKADITIAADASQRRLCLEPSLLDEKTLPVDASSYDKLMWLGARATLDGYALSCREYDSASHRFGPVHEEQIAQASFLDEGVLRLALEAFSPLAHIATEAGKTDVAELTFQGSDLPRRGVDPFVRAGDVVLPMLLRTDRFGNASGSPAAIIPWTYLVTTQEAGGRWEAEVDSAQRTPLVLPRRGAAELAGIRLTRTPALVVVRFHARRDPNRGLAGYEVLRQGAPGQPPQPLGVTDGDGRIVVPVGDALATTILLRNADRLLAKIPVAAGVADELIAPIADDAAGVQAQAEVESIREDLVDIVARRAILMARTKKRLKEGKVADARKLMDELSDLPSMTQISTQVNSAERRTPKSDDAGVELAIESQFRGVREMLARFLDAKPITQLQYEVNTSGESDKQEPDADETDANANEDAQKTPAGKS